MLGNIMTSLIEARLNRNTDIQYTGVTGYIHTVYCTLDIGIKVIDIAKTGKGICRIPIYHQHDRRGTYTKQRVTSGLTNGKVKRIQQRKDYHELGLEVTTRESNFNAGESTKRRCSRRSLLRDQVTTTFAERFGRKEGIYTVNVAK